jgi:hypothetical protein
MRPDNGPTPSGQDVNSEKPVQGAPPASNGVSPRDGGTNNEKNDEGEDNDNKESGQKRSIISSIR